MMESKPDEQDIKRQIINADITPAPVWEGDYPIIYFYDPYDYPGKYPPGGVIRTPIDEQPKDK